MQKVDILVGNIFLALVILTNYPLGKSRDYFTSFEVTKPQQISRINISFIIFKTLVKRVYSPGNIAYVRLGQSVVIQHI